MTTWKDIDNVVLGGALQGIGGVAGELLSAAGDRALAHGMNHATGLVVGYGTEWQRALLMTSKHRPTKRGDIVGAQEHPANVFTYGDQVTIELRGPAGRGDIVWENEGVVFGMDDDGIELEDGPYIEWDEIVRIEAMGGAVWTCYEGDRQAYYEIPASRLQ